jgi:outer membrane protein assembly factor BamB
MKLNVRTAFLHALLALALLGSLGVNSPPQELPLADDQPATAGIATVYLPLIQSYGPASPILGPDWPQLNHDPQHTGYTPEQVDPPYCYAWKWNAVPFASRVQPIVKGGRLFIGSLNGRFYARSASTGEALWNYETGGPIRHTAAATGNLVITGSYDGYTYALDAASGALRWRVFTGSSATAPLVDESRQRVIVASTYGDLTALNLNNGSLAWQFHTETAILTSPSLSTDGSLIFLGSEAVKAMAVSAQSGNLIWQQSLQGQSLADRFPVVIGDTVVYRSQPYDYFHTLLQTWGDDVMDRAGSLSANWATDWARVRPQIVSFLDGKPSAQTFFALNAATGASRGTAPVLYTYGSNDAPNVPIAAPNGLYLTYRARHGIQTDSGTIHVSTAYDAELGRMDLSTLDIAGLTASSSLNVPLTGGPAFRMTSDEAAMITMGGNILWVDNWERLGGINVSSGQIVHAGNVSNNWPECITDQCGPAGPRPFYPLSGKTSDAGYPFPGPRTSEGHMRAGTVIANGMVYWRVVDAGLAAFTHSDRACDLPTVWTDSSGTLPTARNTPALASQPTAASLDGYVLTDLTSPAAVTSQNQDLVDRLNHEIDVMLEAANGQHLMPLYLERGFSNTRVWPYTAANGEIPQISYGGYGNLYWHDPGEFLYAMALAYPYLSSTLQSRLKSYVTAEMGRYSPLTNLPYNDSARDWLRNGSARELNPIVMRAELNNWPPVAADLAAIYSLWLWSKNTDDWQYAADHWAQVQSLFNARSSPANMKYYADIAGAIGYYRLATHFDKAGDATAGMNAAVAAMQNGLSFTTYRDRANNDYPDPRGYTTGWSAPVFYGLTPEVGLYLHEQLNGAPASYLVSLESMDSKGNGVVWWYLTRAGEHAENGETAFLTPLTAWSHFLAHAWILGNSQDELRQWLDRPWAPGDLYSIQKTVAALQAPP